jgi:hypothetical protein
MEADIQLMSLSRKAVTIFAVDKSGSTSNSSSYWELVGEKFNEIKGSRRCSSPALQSLMICLQGLPSAEGDAHWEKHETEVIFVTWDTNARVVTEEALEKCIRDRRGGGGTMLAGLAQFLRRYVLIFSHNRFSIVYNIKDESVVV